MQNYFLVILHLILSQKYVFWGLLDFLDRCLHIASHGIHMAPEQRYLGGEYQNLERFQKHPKALENM